jgi:hypothetical protein
MSPEDKNAALVSIMRDRNEAKNTRALLEHEIRKAGEALYDLGGALRHMGINVDRKYMLGLLEAHNRHAPERLHAKVKEFFETCDRVTELDRRAKEAGID